MCFKKCESENQANLILEEEKLWQTFKKQMWKYEEKKRDRDREEMLKIYICIFMLKRLTFNVETVGQLISINKYVEDSDFLYYVWKCLTMLFQLVFVKLFHIVGPM